jgi:hypothetical protein
MTNGNGGRNDRLEQPNGTKGTTEERPFDCPFFYFYRNMYFKTINVCIV